MKSYPELLQEMHNEENNNNSIEKVVMLVKRNGIWRMGIMDENEVKVLKGKELVIALMDTENPIAHTYVNGEILDTQYNSLYVKFNSDKEIKDHNCFNATNEDIINVLNNEGLVLALSSNNMPRTEKFNQYLEDNNIQLPVSD